MKKILFSSFILVICMATACAEANKSQSSDSILSESVNVKKRLAITINDKQTLTAVLYNNSSVSALVALLEKDSITLTMNDYSHFEKVGILPETLPQNNTPLNTDSGDIILYQGNRFVIYYDKNSWSLTPLGKIENVTKTQLKQLLGTGSITAELSLIK